MSGRVRAVQERRRSNAAGPHTTHQTRVEQLAAALDDWAHDDIPDDAVDAAFDALDPDGDVYDRDAAEVGEMRTVLAAAARHLIHATPDSED